MNQLPTITVQPQRTLIKTGEYRVRVADLSVESSPFEPNRQQAKFTFELLDAPYAGQRLTAFATLSGSPKAKLTRWAGILLSRALRPNESLNLGELIGKEAIAVVVVRSGENGDFNRVEDLRPLPPPNDLFES